MLEKFPLSGFEMNDSMETQLDEDISLGEDDVHEIIEMTDEMMLDLSSDNENNTDSSMEDEVSSQENSFCCSLSKKGQLAATGSQEDKVFLWNAVTGEIIIECTGFKDSVTFVGFNHNDAYLAVADMRGIIKVWQMNTKTCVWETEIDSILWMEWHKSSNVLLVGVATGNLYMFKVPYGQRAAIGFKSGLIHIVDLEGQHSVV